jgi:hypothetical protein
MTRFCGDGFGLHWPKNQIEHAVDIGALVALSSYAFGVDSGKMVSQMTLARY